MNDSVARGQTGNNHSDGRLHSHVPAVLLAIVVSVGVEVRLVVVVNHDATRPVGGDLLVRCDLFVRFFLGVLLVFNCVVYAVSAAVEASVVTQVSVRSIIRDNNLSVLIV